jgi:hypothetical protein
MKFLTGGLWIYFVLSRSWTTMIAHADLLLAALVADKNLINFWETLGGGKTCRYLT